MKKNDQTEPDNDFLDEEEFADLDDLSDLEDDVDLDDEESWDDFEEEEGDEDEASLEETQDYKEKSSFLKKNFTVIIIAIVASAGGLIALGQMGGQDNLEQNDKIESAAQEQGATEQDISSMPMLDLQPMETKMEKAEDSLAGNDLSQNKIDELPGALTPMPSDNEKEQQLDTLDFLTQDTAAPEELQVAESLDDNFGTDLGADLGLSPDSKDPQEQAASLPVDQIVKKKSNSDLQPELETLHKENTALIEKTHKKEQEAEEAARKIQELNQKIKTLENKVSMMKTSPGTVTQPPKKTLKPETKPVLEKPKAKPTPTPILVDNWLLRSAQPGQAVIANISNKDMRNIEVGDVVPGLGRIKSIAVEKGRWVVRGSTGQVSQ